MPLSHASESAPPLGLPSVDKIFSDIKEETASVVANAAQKAAVAKTATARLGADIAATLQQEAKTPINAGADVVATLARSARGAAETLEEGSPEVAHAVRSAAEAVERASRNVREQSLSDLVGATANFAKRHPVAFFGCGVLAGFVVARILSSSQQ